MKDILDSLNEMFDSLYNTASGRRPGNHDSGDPDLDRAWQDLDAFMGSSGTRGGFQEMDNDFAEFDRRFAAGGTRTTTSPNFETLKAQARAKAEADQRNRARSDTRQSTYGQSTYSHAGGSYSQGSSAAEDPLLSMARELVRDYHNLEIKPGAGVDEAKAAYKRLLKQYHPDRFANDPAKQATATQITARLNQSYARIMEHLGKK